jgi:hypothetical protein
VRRLVLSVAVALTLALPASAAALPPIKHVWIIVLENESYQDSFQHPDAAPYLAGTLPRQGELLPFYYGIGHESLDNYIAMVSGQSPNADTQSDCQFYRDLMPGTPGPDGQAVGQGCVYPAATKTVADQLQARGLGWRGYMEDMGTPCRHPALNSQDKTQTAHAGDQYAARHNPFVYFHSLIDTPSCQAGDVPLSRLPGDLASAPAYSFITPNLCHDGHDSPCVDGEPGGLKSADQFLRQWVPRITSSPAYRDGGLLVVTFDEASTGVKGSDSTACCGEPIGPNSPDAGGPAPGPGGGRVGAVLLSPYVQPGTVDTTPYNHYALLRSVEDVFGLGHLGYAGLSPAFGADVFNRGASGLAGSPRRLPRVRIAGVPRRCVRRPFTARIVVTADGLSRLTVRLDGRRVRAGRRVRVRVGRMRPGRHHLRATVGDAAGVVATARIAFTRCLTPR